MGLFVQTSKMIEYPPTQELAASGLGRIELMGNGQACFVYYRIGFSPDDMVQERQVCGRSYMPLMMIPEAIGLGLQALLMSGMVVEARKALRIVGA